MLRRMQRQFTWLCLILLLMTLPLINASANVITQTQACTPRSLKTSIIIDPSPSENNGFGWSVVVLKNKNFVVTAPGDDKFGLDTGAVHLFDGQSLSLISTLHGGTDGDRVGSGGVTALPNGNFVVISYNWSNGVIKEAGAVTWVDGTSGLSGAVSAQNSLVGTQTGDIPISTSIIVLQNSNYLVKNKQWRADTGAVTWGSGIEGVSGAISHANSVVGSTIGDSIGEYITELKNGHIVVSSPFWDNGVVLDAGSATWIDADRGMRGIVSESNSFVGSVTDGQLGKVTPLANGNFVVQRLVPGQSGRFGPGHYAFSWGDGSAGMTGVATDTNSVFLPIGRRRSSTGVTSLSNGHYVVHSIDWSENSFSEFGGGIARWMDGTKVITGTITRNNSIVTDGDNYVEALSNGNYVIVDYESSAVRVVSGTLAVTGTLTAENSLFGGNSGGRVGTGGIIELTNGNVIVKSPHWNGIGALTVIDGQDGTTGPVSITNSIVGSKVGDLDGSDYSVDILPLPDGSFLALNPGWDNGSVKDAGAATRFPGVVGTNGTISPQNSLVGTSTDDRIGSGGAALLPGGAYVISSPLWDNGAITDAGAASWVSSTGIPVGAVSAANSLVGSSSGDKVGSRTNQIPGIVAEDIVTLLDGNYLVRSPIWDNATVVDAGAVTWGSRVAGVTGSISKSNSLIGYVADGKLGIGDQNTLPLENGLYAVLDSQWRDPISERRVGLLILFNSDSGLPIDCQRTSSLQNSIRGEQGSSGIISLMEPGPEVDSLFVGFRSGRLLLVEIGDATDPDVPFQNRVYLPLLQR
jgi:hypothetical protein